MESHISLRRINIYSHLLFTVTQPHEAIQSSVVTLLYEHTVAIPLRYFHLILYWLLGKGGRLEVVEN